jgi:hypothetical protein
LNERDCLTFLPPIFLIQSVKIQDPLILQKKWGSSLRLTFIHLLGVGRQNDIAIVFCQSESRSRKIQGLTTYLIYSATAMHLPVRMMGIGHEKALFNFSLKILTCIFKPYTL